jgi:hypothetical protein
MWVRGLFAPEWRCLACRPRTPRSEKGSGDLMVLICGVDLRMHSGPGAVKWLGHPVRLRWISR